MDGGVDVMSLIVIHYCCTLKVGIDITCFGKYIFAILLQSITF